jgi:hypothetical protein
MTEAHVLGVAVAAGVTVGMVTGPARAGGVGAIGNPSSGNLCVNAAPGQLATGAVTAGGGLLDGNVAQVAPEVRRNSRGSTDLDVDVST